MSSTNLDLGSDKNYHSENKFYYPDKTENHIEKENINSLHDKNHEFTIWTVCKSIFFLKTQRTENTVRKTDYDLNISKMFFLEVGENN